MILISAPDVKSVQAMVILWKCCKEEVWVSSLNKKSASVTAVPAMGSPDVIMDPLSVSKCVSVP